VFKTAAGQKNGLRLRMQRILKGVMPGARAASVAAALLMLIEGATLLAQMGKGDGAIRDARKAASALIAAARAPQ
jgi:hypothetical protein